MDASQLSSGLLMSHLHFANVGSPHLSNTCSRPRRRYAEIGEVSSYRRQHTFLLLLDS